MKRVVLNAVTGKERKATFGFIFLPVFNSDADGLERWL